jgi:electron transport complex protein RnfD
VSAVVPVSGPHIRTESSIPQLMFGVLVALVPATLYGFYLFGWPAINLFCVTVLACLAGEIFGLWLSGRSLRTFLGDGSGLLTGWLLALSLPPWAPWWIGVLGGLFAVIVGKQIFGGIGQNVFNPAMLARVALLVSFPVEMTLWLEPQPLFSAQAPGFFESLAITFSGLIAPDSASGASILGYVKTELAREQALEQVLEGHYQPLRTGLGAIPGSLGETSALLLTIGGIWLLLQRLITWHIPVALLGTVAVLAGGFHWLDPQQFADPMLHLLSGSLIMGAFFIATDPVTSPTTKTGQLVFGAGCGALIYVIRTWGGYPEGVAFAVVLMNAFTPVIDHYLRPRIYGRKRSGQPLPIKRTRDEKS